MTPRTLVPRVLLVQTILRSTYSTVIVAAARRFTERSRERQGD